MRRISQPMGVACVDYGATKVVVHVLEHGSGITLSDPFHFPTPPTAQEGYERLVEALRWVSQNADGFVAISVGFAAPIGPDGRFGRGGNMTDWAGMNLHEMLERDFPGVQILVSNDGPMFATVEIVFGVLADPQYRGMSGMVVSPGSGVATCRFVFEDGRYKVYPSEAQHMTAQLPAVSGLLPKSCGCGRGCVESVACGRFLEQGGATPEELSDDEVIAMIAPGLGALVANLKVTLLDQLTLVVMSGGIAHKRPSLVPAVAQVAAAELGGFQSPPTFVLSLYPNGGLLGALANYMLDGEARWRKRN